MGSDPDTRCKRGCWVSRCTVGRGALCVGPGATGTMQLFDYQGEWKSRWRPAGPCPVTFGGTWPRGDTVIARRDATEGVASSPTRGRHTLGERQDSLSPSQGRNSGCGGSRGRGRRRSPGCNTARRLAWQSNKGAAAFPGASLALPKELRWETNRPA